MPFDFKKFEAKCSTMNAEELQREWEHYTRLISGAATSTAVSGVAMPLTCGVSAIGIGLAAPAIHNARKKRDIIEMHLNRLGTKHNTRKRDVLTPMAISGTVGVVTLGLGCAGSDAITNNAAEHGFCAIAENELAVKATTHLALDAVAMAAEEEHMKNKKAAEAYKAAQTSGAPSAHSLYPGTAVPSVSYGPQSFGPPFSAQPSSAPHADSKSTHLSPYPLYSPTPAPPPYTPSGLGLGFHNTFTPDSKSYFPSLPPLSQHTTPYFPTPAPSPDRRPSFSVEDSTSIASAVISQKPQPIQGDTSYPPPPPTPIATSYSEHPSAPQDRQGLSLQSQQQSQIYYPPPLDQSTSGPAYASHPGSLYQQENQAALITPPIPPNPAPQMTALYHTSTYFPPPPSGPLTPASVPNVQYPYQPPPQSYSSHPAQIPCENPATQQHFYPTPAPTPQAEPKLYFPPPPRTPFPSSA